MSDNSVFTNDYILKPINTDFIYSLVITCTERKTSFCVENLGTLKYYFNTLMDNITKLLCSETIKALLIIQTITFLWWLAYLKFLSTNTIPVVKEADFLSEIKTFGLALIQGKARGTVTGKGTLCIDTLSSSLTYSWVQLTFIDVLACLAIHLGHGIRMHILWDDETVHTVLIIIKIYTRGKEVLCTLAKPIGQSQSAGLQTSQGEPHAFPMVQQHSDLRVSLGMLFSHLPSFTFVQQDPRRLSGESK